MALNGSAVGLGMTMGLSAAIRIAHASSKYGFVFARRGITMESNSSFFLPRLIGYSNALYLLTTGDVYRGDSKHFGSLFQEVIDDPAGVVKRALELASNIADKTSVLAGFMNRELMWRGKPSAEETHLLDSAVLYHMFANRYARYVPSRLAEKLIHAGIAKRVCKASWRSERPTSRPHWSKTGLLFILGTMRSRQARDHVSTPPARRNFESGRRKTWREIGCSSSCHSLAFDCCSFHIFSASFSRAIAWPCILFIASSTSWSVSVELSSQGTSFARGGRVNACTQTALLDLGFESSITSLQKWAHRSKQSRPMAEVGNTMAKQCGMPSYPANSTTPPPWCILRAMTAISSSRPSFPKHMNMGGIPFHRSGEAARGETRG